MADWLKYLLYILFGTTGTGIFGFIVWLIKFLLKNKKKKNNENSILINNSEIKEINNYYNVKQYINKKIIW
ncbi:hypothetical protein SIXOD_v1c25440 [Spiroplasma ixodetis Y32]|nr:hypothetical protein SIXOD_v1c25440 [Spiroplasma ixodetis Y32]